MRNWLVNILIVLALVWLVTDAIWKAQFSEYDLISERIPPWMERD